MGQPVIRGIQAVGAVDVIYRYNSVDNILPAAAGMPEINTGEGIRVSGFRLDSEFLRANPQIASSAIIPILGGGGVALTNNNRTGQLVFTCAKVSTPSVPNGAVGTGGEQTGEMVSGAGIGPVGAGYKVYDMVPLAQQQQAQSGGDDVGASIVISFKFCGQITNIQFDGCTISTVDPIGLAGNDAANYQIIINYLCWGAKYDAAAASIGTVTQEGTII